MSTRNRLPLRLRMTLVELEARAAQVCIILSRRGHDMAGYYALRLASGEAPLKIGIAGTGRMGSAVAGRLLQQGREVTGWNRTAAKTFALPAARARVPRSPPAPARGTAPA